MKLSFKPKEIDDHVLKLTVGLIALSLANLTAWLSAGSIGSISASYYEGGWARDFLPMRDRRHATKPYKLGLG